MYGGPMAHQIRNQTRNTVRTKFVGAAVAVTALTALTACGSSTGPADTAPATSADTAPDTVTSTVTAQPSAAQPSAAQPGTVQHELPAAVTGYTDEARKDMTEDNVTEAEVEAVLQAALEGNAKVEWDDDGYFELEHNGIDIDVDPQGLVRDVDR